MYPKSTLILTKLRKSLQKLKDSKKAQGLQRFFKTGKGEYAEGDIFLGLMVPEQRKVALEFHDLPLPSVRQLLRSKIHEERSIALMILVSQYRRGTDPDRENIFRLYLAEKKYVNNWDLIDGSAEQIVGAHLLNGDKSLLRSLAVSNSLWDRRIAILSTFHFIRLGQFRETLRIAALLLKDEHDLIHKAVGWMLREIGKRDLSTEEAFLKKHCRRMPRTMLRYAIERFPERKRLRYLNGTM